MAISGKRLNYAAAGLLAMAGAAGWAHAQDTVLPDPATTDLLKPILLDNTIVNPADEMHKPRLADSQASADQSIGIAHPWEMPVINVVGQDPNHLREENRIGSYAQPIWAADRRFAETRVYVRPEGALQFEYWFIPTINRHGKQEFETQYELEFGLGHRVQLDLYLNPNWVGGGGATNIDEAIELRYAFADWGVLWGNPTAYIEYTHEDNGPEQLETKILFGGEIATRLHWGWDLTYQRNMGGDNENTYETTAGLSYTLLDSRFDIGAEFKLQMNDFRGNRGHFQDNTFLGPSFQYRPLERVHIDVAPLIGLTHESPAAEIYIVVGWEF
jgi:hypothetical protein